MICFWPIEYGKSDGLYVITHMSLCSIRLYSKSYTETLLFADFEEASCHIVSFLMERVTWQRTQGANSQLGTKALGPPSCRELNAAKTHMSLEVDPFPVRAHLVISQKT